MKSIIFSMKSIIFRAYYLWAVSPSAGCRLESARPSPQTKATSHHLDCIEIIIFKYKIIIFNTKFIRFNTNRYPRERGSATGTSPRDSSNSTAVHLWDLSCKPSARSSHQLRNSSSLIQNSSFLMHNSSFLIPSSSFLIENSWFSHSQRSEILSGSLWSCSWNAGSP